MSETLRKRGREAEALLDSVDVGEPKRFHVEETDGLFHLQRLDKTLTDDDEEEYSPSEELVNGVMRSLEEEIATTCSTSYPSPNKGYDSMAIDISGINEGLTRETGSGVDLCYLLEASDDDLGIPSSPFWDITEEFCPSLEETQEHLTGNPNLKSLFENWHFVDEFENYQLFEFYEHAWDATHLEDHLNIDFVSQVMLFDGEIFSAA